MIGKYPITNINQLPEPFVNQGYRIWYWLLERESAFNCPIVPLTPPFWQRMQNATLVYGIWLPAIDARDHGDVLILVSQDLNHTKKNRKFGDLTARQRYVLFDFILEIDFTHTTGFRYMPTSVRLEIFNKYEQAFRKEILPKKDEKGRYYRGFDDIRKFGVLHPDDQGRIRCPKCREFIAKGHGLYIINSFVYEDGIEFINAICQCCQKPIGVRVASAPK